LSSGENGSGDKIPLGALMNKGLTIKTGKTQVQHYFDPLLDRIKMVITGISTHIFVLFTANDVYMRDFRLFIPADCVAAQYSQSNVATLAIWSPY
jgi:Isochorismatase family